MDAQFFLKLRSNISLEGDVHLAEMELKTLFADVRPVSSLEGVRKSIPQLGKECTKNVRREGGPGFLCRGEIDNLSKYISRLNFFQEIWFTCNAKTAADLSKKDWASVKEKDGHFVVCAIPFMAAAEYLTSIGGRETRKDDLKRIVRYLSAGEKDEQVGYYISKQITSTPHVHGLHKFKAKFFPRLIRSFLSRYYEQLPKKDDKMVLLDPFVGSGTALVEASLLGIESKGIDIDPLSCEISNAKMEMLGENVEDLQTAVNKLNNGFNSPPNGNAYVFPPWIARKFVRWGTPEEQKGYEAEISLWRSKISRIEDRGIRKILLICLSDAISRKFNLRMLGTGVGRFSLEIAKNELSSIVKANVYSLVKMTSVCATLREAYELSPAAYKVVNGNATQMPLGDESVSVVLTSPPYLPASSGREDYLIGKSISITALNMMSASEIQNREMDSVGSMKPNGGMKLDGLPQDVENLYTWLKNDPTRWNKAKPIAVYYKDLKKALEETHRVLMKGGIAIYVIGKESVFYNFSTRKVLYRVACDDIFQKIAEDVGFKVKEKIDVQLDKRNRNARPRSLDAYFETVFVLYKNQ